MANLDITDWDFNIYLWNELKRLIPETRDSNNVANWHKYYSVIFRSISCFQKTARRQNINITLTQAFAIFENITKLFVFVLQLLL